MAPPTNVFELRLHGIVVPFGAGWHLSAAVPDGAFLRRSPSAKNLTLHVRGWTRSGDAAWLRQELVEQNWIGPPTDLREWSVDRRNLIGGTFKYDQTGKLIREWFISDGRRGANASLLFDADLARTELEPFERLLGSVTFADEGAR